jgi:hypothetical protein
MGTILTSYGEAGYAHEGYAAQVLDDGTLTATYSAETEARMLGQVIAACGCGWTGAAGYPCPEPFDEQAHDLALAEWEHDHARPLLEHAQRRGLDDLTRQLRDLHVGVDLSAAANRRELAEQLQRTLRRLAAATELAGRLHQQITEQIESNQP